MVAYLEFWIKWYKIMTKSFTNMNAFELKVILNWFEIRARWGKLWKGLLERFVETVGGVG